MKKLKYIGASAAIAAVASLASCSSVSPSYSGSSSYNASQYSDTSIVTYDRYTMDLDESPIEYTIDISTLEGRTKLNQLTLRQAENLALVEAIMYARCATLFQPQFTHLMKDGNVLRVTVYGTPARYKRKQ